MSEQPESTSPSKRRIINLAQEEREAAAANDRALKGEAGKTFFPSLACPDCKAPAWLDDRVQRIKDPLHETSCPRMEWVRQGKATIKDPRSTSGLSKIGDVSTIAANMRARRSAGEKDED